MVKQIIDQKRSPYNLEAEQSCLGSIILDNEYINEAIQKIRVDDLYFEKNRIIYQIIIEIHDKGIPVDLVTLTNALNDKGLLEKTGGAEYLNDLANIVPSSANFAYYAQIVFEKSLLRRLISASNQILSNAYEEDATISDIMDEAEKAIFDVTHRRITQDFQKIGDLILNTIQTIEKLFEKQEYVTGIPSGIIKLDEMTSGFQNSELIIIAARPSRGKSSLAINIAEHVAVDNKIPIAFFSLEMASEQILIRLLGSQAKVDIKALRSGFFPDSDWHALTNAAALLHDAPVYIDDTPNLGLMELRAKARRVVAKHKIKLILLDYLQLITLSTRKENRQQEISEISRSLKALARELKIPIIALSQLRRLQNETDRPTLSDLRESGAIEQDADVVIFIHQPKADNEEENSSAPLKYELLLEKQRNGPTGRLEVLFHKKYTKFVNLSRDIE